MTAVWFLVCQGYRFEMPKHRVEVGFIVSVLKFLPTSLISELGSWNLRGTAKQHGEMHAPKQI